jgi:hypothetical protein
MLAAQLDRLIGVIGMDTVSLGIVPLGAPVKLAPANGFCLLDDRLAITEDWHAELWLDDAHNIATAHRQTQGPPRVHGRRARPGHRGRGPGIHLDVGR